MKKNSKPKKRWATRFRADAHKSKKRPKGPQTHMGKLGPATPETEVLAPVGQVLGGVVETIKPDQIVDAVFEEVPTVLNVGAAIHAASQQAEDNTQVILEQAVEDVEKPVAEEVV